MPQLFKLPSVGKESTRSAGDTGLIPGLGRSPGKGIGYPPPASLGFPDGSAGEESASNGRDLGSRPGLERSPGEGKGYPLQDSGLENSMGCIVHGVAKSSGTTEQLSLHFQLLASAGYHQLERQGLTLLGASPHQSLSKAVV